MNLRFHVLAAIVSIQASAPAGAQEGGKIVAAPEGPNVLILLADDLGWGDLSLHGNQEFATPNLDALARRGARLEHFYACPEGATTRASLLTGRYHYRTGVSGSSHGESVLPDHEVTFGEALRDAGWTTGWFGKWQNGSNWPHRPDVQGFDTFAGFCGNSLTDSYFEDNDGRPVPVTDGTSEAITREAIAFLEAAQVEKSPWLACVSFDEPRASADASPDSVADAIARIDVAVGRLLSWLSEHDLESRTLVWFLSDNGPPPLRGTRETRFNAYLRGGKGSVHEGGVRVPSLVSLPGVIPPETEFDRIASVIDLLPTVLGFAGIRPGDLGLPPLDGMSLVPALEAGGKPDRWPNRILFTSWTPPGYDTRNASVAVRTDRWLALRDPNWRRGDLSETHSGWELYDLDADPYERFDVSDDYPYLISDMRADFSRWMDHTTDDGLGPIPTEIGHPEWPTVTLRPDIAPFEKELVPSRLAWPVKVVGTGGKHRFEVLLEPERDDPPPQILLLLGEAQEIIAEPGELAVILRLEPGEKTLFLGSRDTPGTFQQIRAVRIMALENPGESPAR